ncbi:MAG: 6-phospho-3-hexuloisomerase [Anaerobacillus sp.]
MNRMNTILTEIEQVTSQVNETSVTDIVEIINRSKRIFVIGEGRSGLMAKSFAMRLMHLGAEVYVVGETITPSISKEDLLVSISGSGSTKSVVWTSEKAASLGCEVIAITTNLDSDLAQQANLILHIPAATKYRRDHEQASIQPLGSLFDQCAHIVFDTICLEYAERKEYGSQQAFNMHSNLE